MLRNVFRLLVLYSLLAVVCFVVFFFYIDGRPSRPTIRTEDTRKNTSGFSWRIPGAVRVTEGDVRPDALAELLDQCPDTPPDLVGPLLVEFDPNRTLSDVRTQVGSSLQLGGRHKPPDCISRHKVAVIVPFRNRHQHLVHWLYYLHPILMRQQLDYGVYVINQDGDGVFNKARLMNAGHLEALKEYDYDCFVFSDVDLVPLDDRNLYRCFDKPRHLAVAVDKFNFTLPYEHIFGGVTSLTKEQFSQVNGFSNSFWGWGGEDDDLYNRIMIRIKSISRPDATVARYKMIKHGRDLHNEPNPKNADMIFDTQKTLDQDGLNSLSYTVQEIMKDQLFTFINVDVHVPPS